MTQLCLNARMGIEEIRRDNLRDLIGKWPTAQAFAEKVKTSAAYISQILSEKTKANLGTPLARQIEDELALGKGWMDVAHTEPAAQEKPKPAEDEIDFVTACIDYVDAAIAMLEWPKNHEMRGPAVKWVRLHRMQGMTISVEMIADTLRIFE